MLSKVLIADRGEIACRAIKTAHRMGIATVAVYSNVDARASFVQVDTQAIHLGYGFLSERASLPDVLAAAE